MRSRPSRRQYLTRSAFTEDEMVIPDAAKKGRSSR